MFASRLVRVGTVTRDSTVSDTLDEGASEISIRAAQRKFMSVIELSHTHVRQIERARYAEWLLAPGMEILGVVLEAGYCDQTHLTRSLKRHIGLTPTQIMDVRNRIQLSFFYGKTGEV